MSALPVEHRADPVLTVEVLTHLDAQLVSVRRLLQVVLSQGAAIRRRAVSEVVSLTGVLQAELQRRKLLEDERARLLERAGIRLGLPAGGVTLTLLEQLMDPKSAQDARERSAELRGLLEQVQREHYVNRALMSQELAFETISCGWPVRAATPSMTPAGTAPQPADRRWRPIECSTWRSER